MSQYGSWSVKGVDDRARAVAKEKARLKGITLGDYINNLLLEGHSEAIEDPECDASATVRLREDGQIRIAIH